VPREDSTGFDRHGRQRNWGTRKHSSVVRGRGTSRFSKLDPIGPTDVREDRGVCQRRAFAMHLHRSMRQSHLRNVKQFFAHSREPSVWLRSSQLRDYKGASGEGLFKITVDSGR